MIGTFILFPDGVEVNTYGQESSSIGIRTRAALPVVI